MPQNQQNTVFQLHPDVEAKAWAVDVVCAGAFVEYRCVDLESGQEVFRLTDIVGSANVGHFLGLVHALAQMERDGVRDRVIYTRSLTAKKWVLMGKDRTALKVTSATVKTLALLRRAGNWLSSSRFRMPMLVWKDDWGKVPQPIGERRLCRMEVEESEVESIIQESNKRTFMDPSELGRWGEDLAASYLEGKGYTIRERDWHSGHRDLDIVALSPDKEVVVFVEVKTRANEHFTSPMDAITAEKIRNIISSALAYNNRHHLAERFRFDVVAIVGTSAEDAVITHIEEAFTPSTWYTNRKFLLS